MKNISAYYCESVFGGVLRRGMLASLNSLVNNLRNEMKVNNFTRRLGKPN